MPFASPFEPLVLLTVATLTLEELQRAVAVRFWVVPSAYLPVAVNCRSDPDVIVGFAGVTETDCSGAVVTYVNPPPEDFFCSRLAVSKRTSAATVLLKSSP